MRFGLVAAGVPLTLFLEMRAVHAQSSRAVCASLQADALQRTDSILAIPRGRWRPEPRDIEERSAIDMAHVVFPGPDRHNRAGGPSDVSGQTLERRSVRRAGAAGAWPARVPAGRTNAWLSGGVRGDGAATIFSVRAGFAAGS